MLKGFRRKVMQIANRLVGQGYIRACAMKTAWKLIKAHAVSTKVVGTSFDNRQNILSLLTKYDPADVSVKLVRDRSNIYVHFWNAGNAWSIKTETELKGIAETADTEETESLDIGGISM